MTKFLNPAAIGVALLLLLAGCYPKGPEYYSDLDLTVTDYDPDYNFADQKSYWIADTVRYITNIDDNDIAPGDVQLLLEKVRENMSARGYERVPVTNPELADLALTVTVIATRSVSIGWIPGAPCWGYWGCGGGWYPPYWGGYYATASTTGSVIINWYDPQTPPVNDGGEEQYPVHWVSTFSGLVSSSRDNNASRIDFSIDQAFKQSPYIQSNK